jgi:CheY-like chemotaxis protein
MVDAMQGRISVTSTEGLGSTFSIELPSVSAMTTEELRPHVSKGIDARPTRPSSVAKVRILVAEDHIVNQKLIRRQLELLGYDCVVVSNGAEALHALSGPSESGFSLLLSDINMPVMDGYALASALRRDGHTPERLPIVFLTADVFNADHDHWKSCGGNAYLTKPTQMEALSECLRQFLSPA